MTVNEIVWACYVLCYCPKHPLLSGAFKYLLVLLNAFLTSSSNMQHLPRHTLWMYRRAACTTYPQSQWVVEVLEGFSTLGTTLSLHGAFRSIWNNLWSMSVLYTNNLFLIAKCTYATPDPVQPDHQYLCVHCVYPICLVSHVPSLQPSYLFQHFAKFLSLFPPC